MNEIKLIIASLVAGFLALLFIVCQFVIHGAAICIALKLIGLSIDVGYAQLLESFLFAFGVMCLLDLL